MHPIPIPVLLELDACISDSILAISSFHPRPAQNHTHTYVTHHTKTEALHR